MAEMVGPVAQLEADLVAPVASLEADLVAPAASQGVMGTAGEQEAQCL